MKSTLLKILIPLLLLAAGLAGRQWLLAHAPEPATAQAAAFVPWVEVVMAEPARHAIELRVMGEIEAARELTLAAEVRGRVVSVAPGLQVGARFEKNAELIRIDDTDALQAVAAATADLARARAALDMTEAEAASARADWESVGQGEASPLARHEPQLALAQAALAAASTALEQAQTAHARCVIRAPYAGITVQRQVEIGAVVIHGQPLARVQSASEFEVRLPLSLAEFDLLGIKLGEPLPLLPVALSATLGAAEVHWSGRINRIEAALDPRDRTIFARAEILLESGPAPLTGMYVTGTILGPAMDDVTRLPRAALRGEGEVLVVDAEQRLRRRAVERVQILEDELFVRGLRRGERVCSVPPWIVSEGMSVRVAEPIQAPPAAR